MRGLKLALRYSFSKSNRHRARSIRIALGLMFSTLALISVLSVMKYLQETRFTLIKEVKSFPVVVETEDLASVKELLPNVDCFLYKEMPALLVSGQASSPVLVRFIDSNYDGGLYTSSYSDSGLLLSPALYYQFSDSLVLSYLDSGKALRRTLKNKEVELGGFYKTKLGTSFDLNYVFLPLSEAPLNIKSYVAVLNEDRATLKALEQGGYTYKLWSDAEASLYQAMMLEKWMMLLVLSLLFVIIMVQINTNARLFVDAKKSEAASFCCMGLTKQKSSRIFALSGSLVSLTGVVLGTLLSYPVLMLIPRFSSLVQNGVLKVDLRLVITYSLAVVLITYYLFYKKVKKQLLHLEELIYG